MSINRLALTAWLGEHYNHYEDTFMPDQYTTDAIAIAKWFVDRANKEFVDEGVSEGLTNLKLQKLLYFAQAVSLSLKDKPIFKEKIMAWKFGPVVAEVYHALKDFKNGPVEITGKTESLTPEAASLLEDVWSVYGKYAAHELVNITHNHLPWKSVYFSDKEDKEITVDNLKAYYADYYQLG